MAHFAFHVNSWTYALISFPVSYSYKSNQIRAVFVVDRAVYWNKGNINMEQVL